ncbi:MAG: 1-acyl-sn-glycerol-3-phosphate acyltransferase [Dictyoglomus sp. NZ13-RE01]|nr:MAG: 1-acyl-sn-glycerol-3-phosphate acyltransferase [Dictyoglomus sp. NZ13-RE01]
MKDRVSKFFYRLIARTVRFLLKLIWKYEVKNIENLPDPPYLIVANHLSLLDPFIIGAIYDFRLYYLAKQEIFKFPLTRPLIRWLGGIDVDRKDFKKDSWKRIKRLIEDKNILVIFPEGTRNENPEKGLLPLKAGASVLAMQYGLTIVPMGIIGTDKVWKRGKILPNLNYKVLVKIGKPIKVDKILKPTKDDIIKLNNKIKEAISNLIS